MQPDRLGLTQLLFLDADFQGWLLAHASREQIIEWLVWNDRNGIYTDQDSVLEGYPHLTLEIARAAMWHVLESQ